MVVDGNEVYEERHAAHHARHEKGTQQHLTDPHLACTSQTVISTTSREALNRGLSPAFQSHTNYVLTSSWSYCYVVLCWLVEQTMISGWFKCSNDCILPYWIEWSQDLVGHQWMCAITCEEDFVRIYLPFALLVSFSITLWNKHESHTSGFPHATLFVMYYHVVIG